MTTEDYVPGPDDKKTTWAANMQSKIGEVAIELRLTADNRPLAVPGVAESREYMCIGVLHDAQVGQASDVVTVVFGG